jgi:uncharacterized damage-inducible protein DinB
MDPVPLYDYLTRTRQRLRDWVRPLSQEQYTQGFPFGLKTLRATLIEIVGAEWIYAKRLRGEEVPSRDQWPINETRLPTFAALEPVWTAQEPQTRALLAGITDWSVRREWRPAVQPAGKRVLYSATLDELAAQLILHEVHHRAQAMAMLRQFGIAAQNLDYYIFVRREREEPA